MMRFSPGLRAVYLAQRQSRWFAVAVVALLAGICAVHSTNVQAQPTAMSANAMGQVQALIAEKESRTAAQRKIDSQLLYAGRMAPGLDAAPGVPTLETDVEVDAKGLVEVDIRAKVNGEVEALVVRWRARGAQLRLCGFDRSGDAYRRT